MKLEKKTDMGLLILRLWLGLNMAFSHGLGKMEHASDFLAAGSLEKFGAPVFFGIMAILAEFLGGILIALGLFTRTAAFFMVSVMIGAGFVVHAGDPWGRKEFALTYAVIALVILIMGAGRHSLDHRLLRKQEES